MGGKKMERTVQDIDREIAALEAKYTEVEGTQTEVYTRIVGYFRSDANWNKGKREEYNYRKTFSLNDNQIKQRNKSKNNYKSYTVYIGCFECRVRYRHRIQNQREINRNLICEKILILYRIKKGECRNSESQSHNYSEYRFSGNKRISDIEAKCGDFKQMIFSCIS